MSAKPKKGLGRGFASLIPTDLLDESFDPTAKQDEKVSELRNIRLSQIQADPNQPRRHFDEMGIEELAESIRIHGILQPIVVVPTGEFFQIVAGERRFRAAKKAGLERIPAIVRTLSNQHKLELSLIENIQRRDLNVLETATAYLKLRDQFNLTLDEIGQRVGGKSVSSISNTLRLLRLPEIVQTALVEGKLREGQARPLIDIDDKIIEKILPLMIAQEWSSRKIESFVSQLKQNNGSLEKTKPSENRYQENAGALAKRFATKVRIIPRSKGAGQIVIPFDNEKDFERISRLLENR